MPALVNQQKFFSRASCSIFCVMFPFFLAWGGRSDFWPAEHIYEGVMLTNWLRNKGCCHITPSKANLCNTMQYNIIQYLPIPNTTISPRNKGFCHIFPSKVDLTCSWLQPPAGSEFKDIVFFSFFSVNSSFAHISTKHNWICRWAWIVNTCFLWRPDFRPQLNQINFDFKLNSPPCLCLCLSSNWV